MKTGTYISMSDDLPIEKSVAGALILMIVLIMKRKTYFIV